MNHGKALAQSLFDKLERKYPNIKLIEGENLNIEQNIERIFTKVYMDRDKYPTVAHIMKVMGICEKRCFVLARKYSLPYRREAVEE